MLTPRKLGLSGITQNADGTYTVDYDTPRDANPLRMSCPGDPGCPGYVDPLDNAWGIVSDLESRASSYPSPGASSPLSNFLSTYGLPVAIGLSALALLRGVR